MNSSRIYFKEIDIDQDNTFAANFAKENEIENVIFDKENEYGITGLNINSILSEEKLVKIENVKEQNRISLNIQESIKNYKELVLTLFISDKSSSNSFCKKEKNRFIKIKINIF